MKQNTLKKKYEAAQIEKVTKKIKLTESKQRKVELLNESLILESFDQKLIVKSSELIKKLKAVDFAGSGIHSLAKGRDAAVDDVSLILGQKSKQGLVRRVVSLFKKDKENPLIDVLAFTDALHNFFSLFGSFIDSHKTNKSSGRLSVQELLTGISADDIETSELAASVGITTDGKKKLKNLESLIKKGFKPDGKLNKIKTNWFSKYFKNNFKQFSNEIMKSNVKDIESLAAEIEKSFNNAEEIGTAAVSASDSIGGGTSTTIGSSKTNTGTKGRDDGHEEKVIKKTDDVYNSLQYEFEEFNKEIDSNTIKDVIATLVNNGKIK